MLKVSVIIPVYNGEKHLRECIDSLLAQTQNDCEFIFINDGSVDSSRSIIESCQHRDARIILINQENQGVSAARNTGINIAKGEYLGFVDADDYVDKDMFEIMYKAAHKGNHDIVLSNFFAQQDNSVLFISYPFQKGEELDKKYITENILPYFVESDYLNSACTKIYKSTFIKGNNITFPAGVALGEDGIFNMKAFNNASTAIYIDYSGYHYKEVQGSATHNSTDKNYFDKVLEVYNYNYIGIINLQLSDAAFEKIRGIRMVNSVLSLVHLYFYASNLSLTDRFKKVKLMLANPELKEVLELHYSELFKSKSRYERFLLKAVKDSSMIKIYFATRYSKIRNK